MQNVLFNCTLLWVFQLVDEPTQKIGMHTLDIVLVRKADFVTSLTVENIGV